MNTLNQAHISILLDFGGSYIKSAVVRRGRQELENILRFPTPPFLTNKEKFKVIPTENLLQVVNEAISEQLKFEPDASRIFISGQMGGYVILKDQEFEIISWQDERALLQENSEKYANILLTLDRSADFKLTGSELRPGLPLVSIAASSPGEKNSNLNQPFRSLISFVSSYLTDFKCDEMHITDAAASGFFDIFNNQWDKNLIALAGHGFTFPKVYGELKKLGYSKKYDLEVFCGVGDQQASLFGAGLTSDKLVVNIGTGGQVAGLQGQFETDGNYQIRPYFNGEKIRTITHLPSGRALKSFVEFVFGENASDSDYEAFINMAGDANEGRIIEISNFDETIELLKERGSPKDIEGLAGAFFHSLIEIYAKSISTLDLEGDLIFAGGVGQKVRIISTGLSALTSREFYISDTDETTLEGLRLLSESV